MSTSFRDQFIQKLRTKILSIQNFETTTSIEIFQNNTLRPILKYQNDALVHIFLMDLKSKKQDFKTFSAKQKHLLIDNHFRKNPNLRQLLLGMVIALFTSDEIKFYMSVSNELNKRIFSMLRIRLKDQLL